jgi:hypothetical protein
MKVESVYSSEGASTAPSETSPLGPLRGHRPRSKWTTSPAESCHPSRHEPGQESSS